MNRKQANNTKPTIHILMGLYNGSNYLPEQLKSISDQTYENWTLSCSDDGSTDDTCKILQEFRQNSTQKVEIIEGPGQGFSENFLSMVRSLPDECGVIAFSDQDDIWLPDKIERGLHHLLQAPLDVPAIYGSSAWIWDFKTDKKQKTPQLRRPPSFLNALVENFATGNTMLLNQPAACLLRDASKKIGAVYAHDWWAYALITGCGGTILYDDEPTVLYRQHNRNEIGAGETFLKRQLRNLSVADGRYQKKVGQNVDALYKNSRNLTPENLSHLTNFALARDSSPALLRLVRTARSGIYRQSRRDMAGLLGAALLGKV